MGLLACGRWRASRPPAGAGAAAGEGRMPPSRGAPGCRRGARYRLGRAPRRARTGWIRLRAGRGCRCGRVRCRCGLAARGGGVTGPRSRRGPGVRGSSEQRPSPFPFGCDRARKQAPGSGACRRWPVTGQSSGRPRPRHQAVSGAAAAPEHKGLTRCGRVVAGGAHRGHRLLPSASCRRPARPGREIRGAVWVSNCEEPGPATGGCAGGPPAVPDPRGIGLALRDRS